MSIFIGFYNFAKNGGVHLFKKMFPANSFIETELLYKSF